MNTHQRFSRLFDEHTELFTSLEGQKLYAFLLDVISMQTWDHDSTLGHLIYEQRDHDSRIKALESQVANAKRACDAKIRRLGWRMVNGVLLIAAAVIVAVLYYFFRGAH